MAIRSALPLTKPSRILLAGDWHGDTDHALRVIKWGCQRGVQGILHLGDFGIWASNAGVSYLYELTHALLKADMWLAFIDGNHEDFDFLEARLVRRGVRPITQRITHLPRGYRWTWGERTWLALGGAVSLDRASRRPHIDWWRQEEISWAQARSIIEAGPVNYMLTHDAPSSVDVPGLSQDWPEDALASANEHRALLAAVVEEVWPKRLFHGHMHVRHSAVIQRLAGLCHVEGLASNIEPFADNILLVDLDARGRLLLPANVDPQVR